MNESYPLNPQVYETLSKAVADGISHVQQLVAENKYIGTYLDFPEFGWFESGLPHITRRIQDKPTNYIYAFSKDFLQKNVASWLEYQNLAVIEPNLKRYYHIEDDVESSEILVSQSLVSIQRLIDRYIHINRSFDFNAEAFRPIYIEWERRVFLDDLPFDIVIPLLYISFDFDTINLGDGLAIERLSQDFQLARMDRKSSNSSPYEAITGAATHGLILKGWTIQNSSWIHLIYHLSNLESFSAVIEKADLYLAGLRAITGIETGYNQMVVRPLAWGDYWTAHLPHVSVLTVRAYPDYFQNASWHNKPPLLSSEVCEEAHQIYQITTTTQGNNRMILACKRLNAAYLRRNEEDAILDVTIALEALLAHDSNSEITYRLSMRLASLTNLRHFDDYTTTEIFDICKKIYGYRSAVVHGSHKLDLKRRITLATHSEPIPAMELGLKLLRYTIRVLSQYPELIDTKKLDEYILGQRLR